jgi:enamine deaminase RidA (YjgF/YER057c/UK114 family)
VFPVSTTLVTAGLALPEMIVQIDADAVIPQPDASEQEIFAHTRTESAPDGSSVVGLGRRQEDAAAQAERALSNLALLLQEAGSGMDDVCKITVYISDRAYRPAVYPVIGKHFRGIHPVSTGIIMPAFARPEILFEIDAQVVPKRSGVPHTRVRPYHSNVARYGTEQQPLDCDFCMAVRAGRHVVLRGQTGVDLDEVLRGRGDAVAQAGQAMDNVAVLLAEAGARLSDVVKVSVFVTDRAFLTGVSELVLRRLAGVAPAFTVMIVKGLASPELLMEVDVTAIIPDQRS